MKKLIILLLIISMFLTACTVQEQSSNVAEEISDQLSENISNNLKVVEEEQDQLQVEDIEKVKEEEIPEETVEEVPKETEEETIKYLKVAEGDTVTAFGKTIVIETIDNYGSLVALRADGLRTKLMQTKLPEVLDGYVYEIVESSFNEDSMVTLSMQKLELKDNEYYLKKDETATVNHTIVKLGDVKSPTDGLASTYVNVGTIDNIWIREGQSQTKSGLKITLVQAFYLFKDAAILKIVPA